MLKRSLALTRSILFAPVALLSCAFAQQDRPPAVPLIVNDPYFSIWSMSNHLAGEVTKHWSEAVQPLTGLLRIDNHVFRWMGVFPKQYFALTDVPEMTQTALEITPLHTRYTFVQGGIELHVAFFTPLLPDDLDVMSRPVTYLSWSAAAIDGKAHAVDLLLDVNPLVAVNTPEQPVTWGRSRAGNLTVLNVGSRDQDTLHQAGDRMRIDWGYFHVAVPDGVQASTALSYDSMGQFAKTGTLPTSDDFAMPAPATWQARAAHLAVAFPLGEVKAQPVERHAILAYTEGFAIEYLGRKLRPYWQRNGMTESAMLELAEADRSRLEERGVRFDRDVTQQMQAAGGDDYAYLAAIAFRQTIAAHKLVADVDGQPMLFSKENDSNGCIDTVDVTYPSAPFFLFFNPRLLEAQLEPLMRYAALPRWRFAFAPHDLGTYPLANGQVYGGGERTEDNQMPVEESGDLILLIDAFSRQENDWTFAEKYFPQLDKWAGYLTTKGIDPENQLSTDDFSGHLAHNANLSIKAIEALGAFADIATHTNHAALGRQYLQTAKSMPATWLVMAREGDHTKLAFDQPGTWSQKYNLVWDRILDLNLFPAELARSESAFYATHLKRYGLPLDNRKDLTKLDWEFWTATLSTEPKPFRDLASMVRKWTNESGSRVPLTDFYDTQTGLQINFQARSVVGGIFIKALADKEQHHRANHP